MKLRILVPALLVIAAVAAGLFLLRLQQKSSARTPSGTLTIYSSTDDVAFRPVIDDFRALYPGIKIQYNEMRTTELNDRFLAETKAGRPHADLLLSSAMDLQAKLVNDGYATPHFSASTRTLPTWAHWRNEAFGFTFEPCVLVFNKALMAGRPLPDSRSELIEAIKQDPGFWRGRIGLYDISKSSVGYLLASQEARESSHFGALTEVLGSTHPFMTQNTSNILAALRSRKLVMGYGVLGSYAQEEIDAGAPLTIVFLQDFTLAVSRTAIIPRNAPHAALAHLFLDYLLSVRGQTILSTKSRLNSVRNEVPGHFEISRNEGARLGIVHPIALGPGLLTYLDSQKKARLLETWRSSMGEEER